MRRIGIACFRERLDPPNKCDACGEDYEERRCPYCAPKPDLHDYEKGELDAQ